MKEVKNLKKVPLLVAIMFIVSMTVCLSSPALAEGTWIEVDDFANEILNDSEQADLIGLVVFAFTIGIIMTILGFAMGIMYQKR